MSISDAIETYNTAAQSPTKISVTATRDSRVVAKLPLVGREIIIEGSPFNKDVKVTPADLAWLCEEARRSMAPGMALLQASLDELTKLIA
jgi:hypothetical protein